MNLLASTLLLLFAICNVKATSGAIYSRDNFYSDSHDVSDDRISLDILSNSSEYTTPQPTIAAQSIEMTHNSSNSSWDINKHENVGAHSSQNFSGNASSSFVQPSTISSHHNNSSTASTDDVPISHRTNYTMNNINDTELTLNNSLATNDTVLMTTEETNDTAEENNTKPVTGNAWDEWKDVFTVEYWKKRFHDRSYAMALILPIAVGFGAGCVLTVCVCCCRRLCARKRVIRQRFDKKFDHKERGDRWTLLDQYQSSDDDENV